MLTITDGVSLARALSLPIATEVKRLLLLRLHELGGDIAGEARFLVVEPHDTLAAVEAGLDFPIFDENRGGFGPEWVADHGGVIEAVWILTDCGFAHVVLLPRRPAVDAGLIRLFEAHVSAHA